MQSLPLLPLLLKEHKQQLHWLHVALGGVNPLCAFALGFASGNRSKFAKCLHQRLGDVFMYKPGALQITRCTI